MDSADEPRVLRSTSIDCERDLARVVGASSRGVEAVLRDRVVRVVVGVAGGAAALGFLDFGGIAPVSSKWLKKAVGSRGLRPESEL